VSVRRAVLGVAALLLLAGPEVHGQRSQRVTFRTADDVVIAASFFEPVRRPAPAVLLVPMLTRSRRDWEQVAARLASEGIAALAIDLRGHGESAAASNPKAATVAAMQEDVLAAYRFLHGRPDVLSDRIGIGGASLGANLAVVAAAVSPSVRSLALLSPVLDYRGVRIEPSLRKYGSRPLLLVASQEDSYSTRTIRELEDEKIVQREQVLLDGAGHGTMMLRRDPTLVGVLVDWFQRTL
jgi:dienelactone hydrolase